MMMMIMMLVAPFLVSEVVLPLVASSLQHPSHSVHVQCNIEHANFLHSASLSSSPSFYPVFVQIIQCKLLY